MPRILCGVLERALLIPPACQTLANECLLQNEPCALTVIISDKQCLDIRLLLSLVHLVDLETYGRFSVVTRQTTHPRLFPSRFTATRLLILGSGQLALSPPIPLLGTITDLLWGTTSFFILYPPSTNLMREPY